MWQALLSGYFLPEKGSDSHWTEIGRGQIRYGLDGGKSLPLNIRVYMYRHTNTQAAG